MKLLNLLWRIGKYSLVLIVAYVSVVIFLYVAYELTKAGPSRYQVDEFPGIDVVRDTSQRPDGAEVLTFYALGDWGWGNDHQKEVAQLLKAEVADVGARNRAPFVLEAGDNVYNSGLIQGWRNPEMLAQLETVFENNFLDVLYRGKPIEFHLVNGNHDHQGDVYQWEAYAEGKYNGRGGVPLVKSYNMHHPGIGDTNDEAEYRALQSSDENLALPEKIAVDSDQVNLIAIDSEAILQLYFNLSENPDLQAHIDLHWSTLAQRVADSEAPWTLILAHHPVRSYGAHLRDSDSVFLNMLWLMSFYLPSYQNLNDPAYIAYIADFTDFAERQPNPVIFISGHDHSLQLNHVTNRLLQVISGSACQTSIASHGADTLYSHEALGFVRFDVTSDELWMQFIYVDGQDDRPVLFRLGNYSGSKQTPGT